MQTLFLACILCLNACTSLEVKKPVSDNLPSGEASPALSQQTEAVYEAVVRYQMQSCEVGLVCFIKVQERDPSSAFLQRFADEPRIVKPISASRKLKDSTVVDKSRGTRGCVIGPDGIRWLGPNSAEVWGGIYHATPGAQWNLYHVKRAEGRWRVASSTVKQAF